MAEEGAEEEEDDEEDVSLLLYKGHTDDHSLSNSDGDVGCLGFRIESDLKKKSSNVVLTDKPRLV